MTSHNNNGGQALHREIYLSKFQVLNIRLHILDISVPGQK